MNTMQEMFKTMTTAQVLHKLRKEFSDKEIVQMAEQCTKGIYLCIESIIGKEVCADYSTEHREQSEEYTHE